jgi:sugar/nucleoside kinase (ribokinase family)
MKIYDVYGIGNGIVDIFLELTDEEFAALEVEKGSMRLVEPEEQEELIQKFAKTDPVLASGGSVANSLIAVSQLGGKSGFACTLGDDRYGMHYKSEFDDLNIELGNPLIVNATTGTSVVIVTPDAERTMRTCLAISSHISEKYVVEDYIKESKWLFVEGYLFSNPEFGLSAVKKGVEYAKKHDCKIAVTFSEAWVIEAFGDGLREVVADADLVFANASEAKAFTGKDTVADAITELGKAVPNYAVTDGEHGAHISFEDISGHVDAFPCTPVDLTGAGDMFAGSFLYGITHGVNPLEAAKGACLLSSKVISHTGARLHSGVKEHWGEVVNG